MTERERRARPAASSLPHARPSADAADPLDEATRPRAPKHPAAGPPRPGGTGLRLKLIHDGLRREMRQIRKAVEQVAAGRLDPAGARRAVNRLSSRQGYRTLGAFCTAYHRTLEVHHTIEDQLMFPELRDRQPSLGPVVERLEQEHGIIAETLANLDTALVALVQGDQAGSAARLDRVRALTARLDRVLSSHLRYEEDELLEPLDRLGIHV
jgi:hypothetical protein